jgi:hypothetical protein
LRKTSARNCKKLPPFLRKTGAMDEVMANIYVENVARLLVNAAGYRSRCASISYRRLKKRRYLIRVPGYHPILESMLLRRVLERLGVPFEVDPPPGSPGRVRRIYTIRDVPLLRKKIFEEMGVPGLKEFIRRELDDLLQEHMARAREVRARRR